MISQLGEGVTGFTVGDAVAAFGGGGGFGTHVVAKPSLLMPLPKGFAFDDAAAFLCTYGTTHHALMDRGALKAGETVLVLGAAGGVGTAAIQIAKAAGAKVIAAASTDEKCALCKELAARFPALELTQLNGTATEVADYVEQGRASLAFHFDRGDPGPAFAHRHLGSVAQGIFVAWEHPLAALSEVGRSDLARHRQLVMQMDGVDELVLSPSVWRADSCYSIAAMAADGVGWAILPLNIAEYEGNRNALVRVPCEDLSLPMLPVRTLWLQGARLSETERWIQQRMGQLLRAGAQA